ncbi:MAG: hypothetical protein EOR00_29680 [Mesorhizobium sp.]|nr:MAG: hypothetical protein EOR00_29680 [Mesorhizobium sp.]
MGQHTIAHRLNAEAVETFGDGGRKAAFWHRSYIAKILKNPAVIGTMTPHETRIVDGKKKRDPLAPTPDYYPAIVPVALFSSASLTAMNLALRDAFTQCVVDFRTGDLRFYWRQGGDPSVVAYIVALIEAKEAEYAGARLPS